MPDKGINSGARLVSVCDDSACSSVADIGDTRLDRENSGRENLLVGNSRSDAC